MSANEKLKADLLAARKDNTMSQADCIPMLRQVNAKDASLVASQTASNAKHKRHMSAMHQSQSKKLKLQHAKIDKAVKSVPKHHEQ